MRWEVSRVVAKVILRDYHFKDNQDISEVRVSVSQYLLQISVENFLAIKQDICRAFPLLPDCNSCDGKVLQANVVSQSLNAL